MRTMAKLKSDELKSFLEIPYDELEEMNLKAAQRAEKAGAKESGTGIYLVA